MVQWFSWQWFDRFWQVLALLICLAVLCLGVFKVTADLLAAQHQPFCVSESCNLWLSPC
jgi:hypothetical protein